MDHTQQIARANEYAFLSACYYPPDERLLQTVDAASEIGSRLQGDHRGSIHGSTSIDALEQDYVRLFVGPFKTLAPPCGSVYLESDARLMGDSTIDVAAWYREDGLENAIQEPPDHVIAELEYLHFLAVKSAGAMIDGDPEKATYYLGREKRFLTTHLARWVHPFTREVETNAETEFYRCLAKITRAFIDEAVSVQEALSCCNTTVA